MGNISYDGQVVLLVDDNEINAEIASLQLRDIGLQVEWVTDGQKAVEAFEKSTVNQYAIIVMDIMMPVMDGIEAIKAIRELDRADASTIPIIAVSANNFSSEVGQISQNGVSCFITKPYSKSFFQNTVREQIELRQVV